MKFHLLTVAHSIPGDSKYSTDPFTNKAMTMSKFLFNLGHEVIYYGVEGGEGSVVCTKYVSVIGKDEFYKSYPNPGMTRDLSFSTADSVAWTNFLAKAPELILENTNNKNEEFLLCFFGHHHKEVSEKVGLITVEPGIGHSGSFAPYRIFESNAWMHFVYGEEGIGWPQNRYDTVIPNFYFPDDFDMSKEKDDYFMFMGRIIWGKGVSVAVEVANYFNKKIIVAGHGDLKAAVPDNIPKDNVEYVGVLSFEDKIKYMRKAKAFFAPSLYVEPFGHVVPEASLCGTPVMCTNYGAFTETVKDGVNGFHNALFNDYVENIKKLDTIDPIKCRQFAIDNFSVDAIAPKYEHYFKNLLHLRNDKKGWYYTEN